MLRELRVLNFAVIESATVEFAAGLNVLTGETGAGKSMLIDAILKLHDQVQHAKLGVNRLAEIEANEESALKALPTSQMKGLLR